MNTASGELKRNVSLILSQVRATTPFYKFRTTELAKLRALASATTDPRIEPRIEAAGDAIVVHEQLVALKLLYARSTPPDQKAFAALLMSLSTEENAAVIVHAMIEIGELRHLTDALKNTTGTDPKKRQKMWPALREKLQHESHRFTEPDLTLINDAAAQEYNHARAATLQKLRNLPPH